MSDLIKRYTTITEAHDQLVLDRERLEQELQPFVDSWTAFVEGFEKEHGLDHSWWGRIGGWPAGNRAGQKFRRISYELEVEDTFQVPGFHFKGTDYDGDFHSFALPAEWVTDPEACKAEYTRRWSEAGAKIQAAQAERDKAHRRATYLALHKEFGESNPSQS